jgi:alcohol dehydrogenase (cytochrome c)
VRAFNGLGFFVAVALAITSLTPGAAATVPLWRSADSGADWGGFNRNLQNDRFSPLREITPGNVSRLKRICTAAVGADIGFETGPIVVDGVMYATTIHNTYAFDAANCKMLWASSTGYPQDDSLYGITNRGAAYAGGKLYRGTIGNHVLGIDARTGKKLWDTQVATLPSYISASPITWRGAVFIGLAGGDDGGKGEIFALDAATGKVLWSAVTVPADPLSGTLPDSSSWGGAKHVAGGATWSSYTLDPYRGLLLVSTGNPGPDFFGGARIGDDRGTASLLVFNAFTGALLDAHQFVHHDVHDWDITASSAYVAQSGTAFVAGKDGLLRRITLGDPNPRWTVEVTTVDDDPALPLPGVPEHFCPGDYGGVEWNGPAYSPVADAVFVNSVDWCNTLTLDADVNAVNINNGPSAAPGPVYVTPGQPWLGTINYSSAHPNPPFGVGDSRRVGHVTAVDARTGRLLWQYDAIAPMLAGITPTASGLVFTADLNGNFFAFDATTGRILRQMALNEPVGGGVITYAAHCKQFVAVAAGMTSPLLWHTTGTNQIAVFGL